MFLLPYWPHFNLLNLKVSILLLFVFGWVLVLSILVLFCSDGLWLRTSKESFTEIIIVLFVTGYFRKNAAQSWKSLIVSFRSFKLRGKKKKMIRYVQYLTLINRPSFLSGLLVFTGLTLCGLENKETSQIRRMNTFQANFKPKLLVLVLTGPNTLEMLPPQIGKRQPHNVRKNLNFAFSALVIS